MTGQFAWLNGLAPVLRMSEDFPMVKLDRIVCDPRLMNGQPCLRGLRLTVRRVVEITALYPDPHERAKEYPELEQDDIRQALHYAALQLPDQVTFVTADALVA